MSKFLKSITTTIEEHYDELTQVEKRIADYFINNMSQDDYSSKNVASQIYVSEASLSRFAKKLGFKGYREFVFAYTNQINENKRLDCLTEFTIHLYETILEKAYAIIDNHQMVKIAKWLDGYQRVFIYGVGSSSLAAQEFYSRFRRIGLDVDAQTSPNDIALNISRVTKQSLVIGISISGITEEVVNGLKAAHQKGAKTILLTGKRSAYFEAFIDEIVRLAYIPNMNVSNIISPQLPALIMIDIIYTHYLNYNREGKIEKLNETLKQINYPLEKS